MEPIAQDTCGVRELRELRAVRAAIRATARGDRPPGSPACLVLVFPEGPALGATYPLGAGPVVVGRVAGPGVGVVLADPSVSRLHARLDPLPDGRLRVTDLRSTNGTFVNDVPVATGELIEGDFLRVGDCVFRYLAPRPPAPG